jgi:hypothetical protein
MSAGPFWDAPAETMPPEERTALQMARIRACVERLQRSGNSFYARLSGIDYATLSDWPPSWSWRRPARSRVARAKPSASSISAPTDLRFRQPQARTKRDIELFAAQQPS